MNNHTDSETQNGIRRLAAIMFTDIVGFSRKMGADEDRMLRLLETHNKIVRQTVDGEHGHVIKTVGDAFLVDFPSVVGAVQCAQRIQEQFRDYNAEKETAEQIHVRIGIHLGDIVQRDNDVFGDGVNIASRLQALADPDAICISDVVYRDVSKKMTLGTVVSLGRPQLKNIVDRFQVYALLPGPTKGIRRTLQVQRLKLSHHSRLVRVSLALLGLLIVGAGVMLWFPSISPLRNPRSLIRTQGGLSMPDKPSIVVLPFVNMSGDPAQEYFSDGITEDITTDLSKLSSLFVIARNSAFAYKGKAVKAQDVSKELGVRYILEGSVRRAGEQLRVTGQLIDAATGGHLWSERYDRPMKEVFILQDEIVRQIVANLRVEVEEAELQRVRRVPTENLKAYDFNLRGWESQVRAFHETNREAQAQARKMFEKAIELDPRYADAYAGLSMTYFIDWLYRWNPTQQVLEKWSESARKAIELDPSQPTAHESLSWTYLYKRQHDLAIAEAERAVALNPNSAEGYRAMGFILSWAGRSGEAIGLLEKAMRLNPRYSPVYLLELGIAYQRAGEHEKAIVVLNKALALIPNAMPVHVSLASSYAELGRLKEARAEAAEVLRIDPHFSVEAMRPFLPFKDPAMLERQLAAMRKAGLK